MVSKINFQVWSLLLAVLPNLGAWMKLPSFGLFFQNLKLPSFGLFFQNLKNEAAKFWSCLRFLKSLAWSVWLLSLVICEISIVDLPKLWTALKLCGQRVLCSNFCLKGKLLGKRGCICEWLRKRACICERLQVPGWWSVWSSEVLTWERRQCRIN